jgi:hypothetical protein
MKKLLSFALLLGTFNAFSWGLTGHRIVGHIAMDHLNPEVRSHILETLGGEDLAQVSNWMDFIKSEPSYDSLNAWHYCTVESVDHLDHHEHPDKGDVWMAIDKFLNEITTQEYSVDEAFALRALAHLIGDVHQPLHCGNGTDMGGNQVKVKFFWESSNLHRVWDSGLIDYWKMSYTEYSTWIMGTVTPEHIQSWKGTTTKDWVRESVEMREQCYSTMGDPERMGYRYVYDNTELLHLRLAQAGVRLADALNQAYAARG